MPTDLRELRQLRLFREMSDAGFERLVRAGYVQTFPPQIELITEGDTSDFLYILVEGSVELVASWKERETVMTMLRPMAAFILAATVTGKPYLMSGRTLEKSRLALLPSEDVRQVMAEDNAFAQTVALEFAGYYRTIIKHTKNLKLRTSQERLANFLLRQHRRAGEPMSFELTLEKRRLASYLNMTPENLSRALRALKPHGVTVEGSHVVVDSPADLERLAKPSPLIDDPIH